MRYNVAETNTEPQSRLRCQIKGDLCKKEKLDQRGLDWRGSEDYFLDDVILYMTSSAL